MDRKGIFFLNTFFTSADDIFTINGTGEGEENYPRETSFQYFQRWNELFDQSVELPPDAKRCIDVACVTPFVIFVVTSRP